MTVARHTDDTVANLPLTNATEPLDGVDGYRGANGHDAIEGDGGLDETLARGYDGADVTAEHVDLSVDPFDDNLADELAARQPRRLTSRTTLSLAGAVLIVAGFVGGVLVQKNFGTTGSSSNSASGANGRGGAGGFGGFGGGTGAGGTAAGGQAGTGAGTGTGTGTPARNATTGTVKLVDGTTVYLTTADGSVITVKTSGSTTVKTQQAATLKDLPAGATVTVQGTADADGIITATAVTGEK